jgi:tRNA 2-thiouridine synthesizing protein A
MADKIDARGLSCPQPVILTNKKIKEMGKGVFEILVDTDTAKENISRLAQQMEWDCEVKRRGDEYLLVLKKGEKDDLP